MIVLLFALALFVVSVLTDRVLHKATLAQWSFGFSCIALCMSIQFILMDLFVVLPPLELGELSFKEFYLWTIADLGGWSMCFSYVHFICASGFGVMYFLARFVDAVNPNWYGFLALVGLFSGTVFLIGFFVFFEGFALFLGIIATIIGILVGIKRLYA